jgi:DNA-binding transcriptional LysR family regulator
VHQLRYFVSVARTRHFSRAAASVHVAQPSLSKQIQNLETELGTPLFNRARGNITLTPAGETLLPIAQRIIADLADAHVQVQELVGLNRGRLRLGATPSLCTIIVPEVLRRFHDAYPGIDVIIEERGSRDLVPLLAQGALDFALIILPLHRRDPALTTTPILREPLVVAAAADAPLRAKALRVRDLQHHPLVMFRDGYDLRDATLAACRRARVEPRIAVEGGEMDAVLRFVETGLGIAVVPTMVLQDRPRLRRIRFRSPGLSRTIGLAHRRDINPSAAARQFQTMLFGHLSTARRSRTLPSDVELIPTTRNRRT